MEFYADLVYNSMFLKILAGCFMLEGHFMSATSRLNHRVRMKQAVAS